MRAIWRLALDDLRRTMRDRAAFFWMIVMPLAMMWFLGGIGGGGDDGPPQISLSVENLDDGWLSDALVEELTDESDRHGRSIRRPTEEQPPRVRTLVIPAGFTDAASSPASSRCCSWRRSPAPAASSVSPPRCTSCAPSCARSDGSWRWATRPRTRRAASEFRRGSAAASDLVTLSVSTAGEGRAGPAGAPRACPASRPSPS